MQWLKTRCSAKDPKKHVMNEHGHFISMKELNDRLMKGHVLRIQDRTVYPQRLDIDSPSARKPSPVKKEKSESSERDKPAFSALSEAP